MTDAQVCRFGAIAGGQPTRDQGTAFFCRTSWVGSAPIDSIWARRSWHRQAPHVRRLYIWWLID